MNILIVHNRYREAGGEDVVADAEVELLRNAGHTVVTYFRDNHEIDGMSRRQVARDTVASQQSVDEIGALISEHKVEIMHVHNFLPLVSPAVFSAAHQRGVGVVHTLHNFRLICPAATLLLNGKHCEKCVGKRFAWPAVVHSCYRNSATQSLAVASMLSVHRRRRTFVDDIDAFISLSDFACTKYVAGGLPEAKIVTKPNFVLDPPAAMPNADGPFLCVGRLSEEKGISVLIAAWEQVMERCTADGAGARSPQLVIAGDGELRADVTAFAQRHPGSVQYVGAQSRADIYSFMQQARAVIVPSIWHEPFGLVSIEAFAAGTGVIATNHGALPEIVGDGESGWLVEPNNPAALAGAILAVWQSPDAAIIAGTRAREVFDQRYSAAANLQRLNTIYTGVVGGKYRE